MLQAFLLPFVYIRGMTKKEKVITLTKGSYQIEFDRDALIVRVPDLNIRIMMTEEFCEDLDIVAREATERLLKSITSRTIN